MPDATAPIGISDSLGSCSIIVRATVSPPTPEQLDILHNYFELAEIHVTPNSQGHGLGLCLIEELAWNAPASYLLLSTPEVPNEANAAFSLYRKVGFFDVLRNLEYPADERAFAILAARLPLSAT